MGEVWVAEQLEPIRRRVALKLIKPGMDTRSVLARFEAERQALAVMDHPNIAKVLDAGTTPDGRPYFVMELVKGTPITEFCDARKLTPARAAGAVRAGLPGDPARPPEGHHPPRHQAVQRAGRAARRDAGAEGDRLRRRQGDRPAADREDASTPASGRWSARRRTWPRSRRRSTSSTWTRGPTCTPSGVLLYELLAGSPPIEQGAAEEGGAGRGAADRPRRGAAAAEPAAEHVAGAGDHRRRRGRPTRRSSRS